MPGAESHSEGYLQQIRDALSEFEPFGLGRPASVSLGEYLQFLSQAEVLPQQVADSVAARYYRNRYGGAANAEEPNFEDSILALQSAIAVLRELDEQQLADLVSDFSERFDSASQSDSSPSHAPEPAASSDAATQDPSQFHELADSPSADKHATGPQAYEPIPVMASDRKWFLWLAAVAAVAVLVMWTMATLFGGYLKHQDIADAVRSAEMRYRLGIPIEESNERVSNLRKLIASDLDDLQKAQALQGLANAHVGRFEYAEAITIFQQAMARAPDDAELLNDLAWLLLTADDRSYRDRIQALELAQRAVAANPRPHIMDTLAEACFQNGDFARAVKIEEQAMRKDPAQRDVYRHQLYKFRRALQHGQTRIAAPVSPNSSGR